MVVIWVYDKLALKGVVKTSLYNLPQNQKRQSLHTVNENKICVKIIINNKLVFECFRHLSRFILDSNVSSPAPHVISFLKTI